MASSLAAKRRLRAQFQLEDGVHLTVDYGDIFEHLANIHGETDIEARNTKTGAIGRIPRPSNAVYVNVYKTEIAYSQPLILIGSFRDQVQDLLLARLPQEYAWAVPHTTRMRRTGELHGREYYFVRRSTMEQMLSQGLFIDAGEHAGELYGTSEASVRQVAQKDGKHCVLDSSNAIVRLMQKNIFPIVVFVGATSWRRLLMAQPYDEESEESFEQREQHAIDELKKDEEALEKMGIYLNGLVRESNVEDAFLKVVELLKRLDSEPPWLPEFGDRSQRLI